jgi:uncharacterized protein YggE
MALSERSVSLLHEIYEITTMPNTVFAGGEGTSRLVPDLFNAGLSVREQLEKAIEQINQNPSVITRIEEILAEWEELSIDPSKIEQEGYFLKPEKNIKAIRKRLYTYTGIIFSGDISFNRIPLG